MMISTEKYLSLKKRVSCRHCQRALEKLDRTRWQVPTFSLPEGQEKEMVSGSTTPRESLKEEKVPPALVCFNSRTSVCFLWRQPHLDMGGWVPGKRMEILTHLCWLPLPMASRAGPIQHRMAAACSQRCFLKVAEN